MTNNKINILYHQKLQKLDPVGQFCSLFTMLLPFTVDMI